MGNQCFMTHRKRKVQRSKAESVTTVKAEAQQLCRQNGGHVANQKHVLGCFKIQFGQFRGMTFKWLLENSPGYAGFIVADTEKEEPSQNNLWLHKMALKKYIEMFEEGVYILQSKRQKSQPK
ncbi:hypothetical protein DPMN_014736, partial [Dreissena polymorpha]